MKVVKKIVSKTFSVLVILIIVCTSLLCFNALVGRFNNTPASFFGYSFMQVSSPSMVASGFDVGEKIIVRSVDTSTLKPGDCIAYYLYEKNYSQFDEQTATLVTEFASETKYSLPINLMFGFQSDEIKEAAKPENNCNIIFHEIIRVYKDQDGQIWFKTKGSSNEQEDLWFVNPNMVVGIYDNSPIGSAFMWILNITTSMYGLLILVAIPILIATVYIIAKIIKYMYSAIQGNGRNYQTAIRQHSDTTSH